MLLIRGFIALFLSLVLTSVLCAQSYRVMSYNLRYPTERDGENAWSQRKEDVAALLAYYRCDFIGVQEAVHQQMTFLDDRLPQHAYVGVGRDDGATKGEYAAIFYDSSRFDLLATTTFWLSERPEEISVGWDAAMERVCTYGLFRDRRTRDSLHLYNAHFDHLGEVARLRSAELMLARVAAWSPNGARLIVMGDLNAEPASAPLTLLTEKLDDPVSSAAVPLYGPAGTFNGFDLSQPAERRIDYVLTRKLAILNYRHVDDRRPNNLSPSDHLPVLVELVVPQ